MNDRLKHLIDAQTGFGGNLHRVGGVQPDHIFNLLADAVRLGGGQVDLVENGNDLVIVVERLVDVGERLRLHALAGIHHQQRTLARGQTAADLISEVNVAGRVDQIELIGFAVARDVVEPHRLRLDGNAALTLDVHRVEHLLLHLARGKAAADLDQPVGKRRLAMVDMRDDGKIADMLHGGSARGGSTSGRLCLCGVLQGHAA